MHTDAERNYAAKAARIRQSSRGKIFPLLDCAHRLIKFLLLICLRGWSGDKFEFDIRRNAIPVVLAKAACPIVNVDSIR